MTPIYGWGPTHDRSAAGSGRRSTPRSACPSTRCSCTNRGMRSAVMPVYHVPSGYTTMIGPPAQMRRHPHLRPVAGGRAGREREVPRPSTRALSFVPRGLAGLRRAARVADAQEDVPVELPDQELLGDRRRVRSSVRASGRPPTSHPGAESGRRPVLRQRQPHPPRDLGEHQHARRRRRDHQPVDQPSGSTLNTAPAERARSAPGRPPSATRSSGTCGFSNSRCKPLLAASATGS